MNRIIAALATGLVAGALTAGGALPAGAEETPPPPTPEVTLEETPATDELAPEGDVQLMTVEEPVENCIGVSWQKPQGGAFGPQYVIAAVTLSGPCDEMTIADVPEVTCVGQGDIYADDEATAALIAGGVLYGPGNPYESWPSGGYQGDGVSSKVWDHGNCVEPTVCTEQVTNPTSTNLDPQGWVLVGAEHVPGGLRLTAENWEDAYAYHAEDFPLSASEILDLDFTTFTGGVSAIILETALGNVHYEPDPYTHDFWTNAAGILPANGGGQGGPFSGNIEDLQSDPQVTGVYLYFSSGNPDGDEAVLASGSVNCWVQPFDFASLPDLPTVPPTSGLANTGVTLAGLPLALLLLGGGGLALAWHRRLHA